MNRQRANAISDYIIKWCLYAIVFAAPFSKSISEISITLAIILWIFKKGVNRDIRIEETAMNIPFIIFVASIIPSLFISSYPALSIRALFTKVLKFVLLYFVIVDNMNTKNKLKDLFIIAFLSAVIILADGLIQHYYAWTDGLHNYPSFKFRPATGRTMGFFRGFPTASFPFPNDLAAWILLVLFPLLYITIFDLKKRKIRYLTGAVSLGLFHLLFLTKARGAWLGFVGSIIYIAISKRKIWLIIFLILLIALPFVLKMEMAQYIFGVSSIGDRLSMWRTGWEIFKRHPIIGNGLNTFFVNFKKYRMDEWKDKKGSYAHNCYLQMAADTGAIGLAAFIWLMLSYFYNVIKTLKKIQDEFYGSVLCGISIGVFAFLIHSFFDTNLYSLNLATLFWYAIGLSQSISKVSLRTV